MLTEVSVLPPEVSENLRLPYTTLFRSTVSVLEGLDGLPKLSWLWTVIGPAVGLEVAVKLKIGSATSRGLDETALTVSVCVTVELNAAIRSAAMVGVAA